MEEVVLKGDWFWQISLTLKGTKRIPYPLREYLDRKPELAALWREHVVEALEREGFQDNENGMFVNFAGNVRKLSEVMTILSKMMEDPWVKKNVIDANAQEVGAVMHFDFSAGEMVRDARHPSKEEMEAQYGESQA